MTLVRDWKLMGTQSWGHCQETQSADKWQVPAQWPTDRHACSVSFLYRDSGWRDPRLISSCRLFCWECWWECEIIGRSASTECDQTSRRRSAFLHCDRGLVLRRPTTWKNCSQRSSSSERSMTRILRPLSGNGFYLLHDEPRLRGQTRGGPLRQSRGVLR